MRFLLFLVLLLHATAYRAQNLVPNGSFEEYSGCPEFISSIFLTGWQNLHTNSADYFNSCSDNGVADVPLNQFGYQYAADGQAYVGMATTAIDGVPWYREVVGIQLSQALQPGVPVCLSFETALGGFGSWTGNSTEYSSKGLGLKFFTQFPSDWEAYLYPNSAALSIDYVPTDTAIWYSVSGTYVPDSAYMYVAIGNFFTDSLSELTLIDSTGYGALGLAYAFVDDIRVSFDLSYCDTNVAIAENSETVMIYPMPCGATLNLQLPSTSGDLTYRLLDTTGRVCGSASYPTGSSVILNLGDLPDGSYLLQLSDGMNYSRTIPIIHLSP